MKNRKSDLPTIGVEGIAKYVQSQNEVLNRHFVYMPDGSQFYCIKGEMIPAECMVDNVSELRKKGVYKGANLDGRTNWIE